MVSLRCKMLVEKELKNIGLHAVSICLGEVEIKENITPHQCLKLKTILLKSGLELMDRSQSFLIEKIKNVIIEMVHYSDDLPRETFSNYLSKTLNYNYTYLANLFSETEGRTIEHFIMLHKIERVKELIIYNELNLTEISFKMNYSSVSALSNQFKKVTGLTPSFYKQLKEKRKKNLEDV